MSKPIIIRGQQRSKYSIKEIFTDHWDSFEEEMAKQNKAIRQVIKDEIEKVVNCQDPKMGFALYVCTKCDKIMHVPFTCKSRFCNSCGAKYSKDRALNMSGKLLNCSHRHVVFTIPAELRKYFAYDRELLNLLFTAASDTITYCFNKRNKSEKYVPGMICVLHTFGRDLKWNPHIHMLLCEEAIGNSNKWKKFNHINYDGLRRSWQYCILKLLSRKITDPSFKLLVNKLYARHKDGFYVNAPPIKRSSSGVINYIVRYAGRPVLAQSRIVNYDGRFVTFTYTPHGSEELVTETISVFDFIKRLIIHIPEKNFKMIRYYGFYAVSSSKYRLYMLRAKNLSSDTYNSIKNVYHSWRKRIFASFSYDPIKCICGGYFELIEIFCNPRKIKHYYSRNGPFHNSSIFE